MGLLYKQGLSLGCILGIFFLLFNENANADKFGRSAIWNRRTRISNEVVIGIVERMQEQSLIYRKGGTSGNKVSLGMRVYEGDVLKTPQKSKVHVRFKDGTYIEWAEESKFQIERIRFSAVNPLKPNKASDQFDESIFRYYEGIVHVFAEQIHSLQHFVIKTPTAVIQALEPSDFYILKAEDSKEIQVKVKKGKVFLLNTVTNENTEVSSGRGAYVKSSGLVNLGGSFSSEEEAVLIAKTKI